MSETALVLILKLVFSPLCFGALSSPHQAFFTPTERSENARLMCRGCEKQRFSKTMASACSDGAGREEADVDNLNPKMQMMQLVRPKVTQNMKAKSSDICIISSIFHLCPP